MQTIRTFFVRVLALCLAASVAFAQQPLPSPGGRQDDRPQFRQEELDQMLAPIALYPDALLSQVLMAATYPLEVVQAARWSRANPGLKGEQAVRAVEGRDWDPSVKSLVAFPQVLAMMDERLDWTERLGDAFLGQQADVMDSVQFLRDKAYAAGNLRSNERMRVTREDRTIVIEPPEPQVVYVPVYNPTVVYGGWWWPAYPPVYWPAPVVYYPRPAYVSGFVWGVGVSIGAGFFYGACDWPRRQVVNVVNVNNYYYTKNVYVDRTRVVNRPLPPAHAVPAKWEHNPVHRRGVPYRDPAVREAVLQSDRRDDGPRFNGRDGRDARDGRDGRGDIRPQDRAVTGTPNTRPEGRSDARERRDADPRTPGVQPRERADWRETQRENVARPEPRPANPRVETPAPVVQPRPAGRDVRGEARVEGRETSIPAAPKAPHEGRPNGRNHDEARNETRAESRGGGDPQRLENRGGRGEEGRGEARRPDPAPVVQAAPAPVPRAPEARGPQPRMEGRPEARADNNPGERRADARGDNGGGRGRDSRPEMRQFESPAPVVQPPAPVPRPQAVEPRAPAPTPAPQARLQAPAQPVAPPPAPRAAPAPSASAPVQQGGGGNANGGGRGGGGMMHGGGPPMR